MAHEEHQRLESEFESKEEERDFILWMVLAFLSAFFYASLLFIDLFLVSSMDGLKFYFLPSLFVTLPLAVGSGFFRYKKYKRFSLLFAFLISGFIWTGGITLEYLLASETITIQGELVEKGASNRSQKGAGASYRFYLKDASSEKRLIYVDKEFYYRFKEGDFVKVSPLKGFAGHLFWRWDCPCMEEE